MHRASCCSAQEAEALKCVEPPRRPSTSGGLGGRAAQDQADVSSGARVDVDVSTSGRLWPATGRKPAACQNAPFPSLAGNSTVKKPLSKHERALAALCCVAYKGRRHEARALNGASKCHPVCLDTKTAGMRVSGQRF